MHIHKMSTNIVMNHMINFLKVYRPILFDVSLRDGLQTLNHLSYPTEKKMLLFKSIIENNNYVKKLEIGSIVSPKILPIMSDTLPFYDQCLDYIDAKTSINVKNHKWLYVLVPSLSKLQIALDHGITNMSFITSVSDEFQKKNVGKSLRETQNEFKQMESMTELVNKKLYISCIDECPIVGKIPVIKIVNEISHYAHGYKFDELCLSDTCGTLKNDVFMEILNGLQYEGVEMSQLSVHLHVGDEEETKRIIHKCIRYGINKFDVSSLIGGGCSVTMKENINPNLTYELFYKAIKEWIEINKVVYDV